MEKTFRDEWILQRGRGWLRFDEEGCLFIVDRLKDVVPAGGFSVFPNEIHQGSCTILCSRCLHGRHPHEHSGEVPKKLPF